MPRSSSRSSGRSSSSSRGSGGMFGGGSAPARSAAPATRAAAPAPAAAPRQAPAPVAHAPPPPPMAAPMQSSGGFGSGIMGTIASGMAFGTGSAIAHRAVGAMFGGSSSKDENEAPAASSSAAAPAAPETISYARGSGVDCSEFQRDLIKCMQENKSDIAWCQNYMDGFNQCQADAKLA